MTSENKGSKTIYDVAICGSGLAGLTLARQLKLNNPNLSIIALDKLSDRVPEATFKVGESTVYAGAYYLSHVLQLEDYFKKNHLIKLGLRFFFGDARGLFKERPELGLSEFPPAPESYQIDRGHLEKELRLLNQQMGVEIQHHCSVTDIELAEKREKPHKIFYSHKDEKKKYICEARWVIDAMGRRRFLQKKLGLGKPNNPNFNAVWFRVQGRIDVSDFVPITERSWHDRVPENKRYYSTNHLCGEGYWIWLIPLASKHTSIGIVAKEEIHAFKEFHTYELAYKWLEKYEPVLANFLKEKQAADFKKMPKYSYSSSQVFSKNRWASVGDAGVFPDPFYSPGMDLIGYGNSLVTQAIGLELEGKLTQEQIDKANEFYLTLNDKNAESIHNIYSFFGKKVVMATKFIWDIATGMPSTSLLRFNSLILDLDKKEEIGKNNARISQLAERMEQFFLDWSSQSLGIVDFEFIDYWKLPFLHDLRSRNLKSNKTDRELIDDSIINLEIIEELAQAIFLLALEDTMPEKLARLPQPIWLNAWAISLDPKKWEEEGLFSPKTKPRDLGQIIKALHGRFKKKLEPVAV